MRDHTKKELVPPVSQVFEALPTGNIQREFSSIHKYFEKQVLRSPYATALITEDQNLTFDELEVRASQLAVSLVQRGIGPGSKVAIFIPRSIDGIVALLACLKSGAAYVPIGTNYPKSFVDFIIEDMNPDLALTNNDAVVDDSIPILRVDQLTIHVQKSDLRENKDWSGDAPAWILYTSGSSGRPKAVKGLHRGIVQRCEALWALQPFSGQDVAILNTALTVVDSHWEIWAPLSKGIPVVILDEDINQNPRRLIQSLRKFKVTRICLVPSLLRSILNTVIDLECELPHLNLWVVSGELLASELVRVFYQIFPDATLHNQYGLTETSADITSFNTRLLNNFSLTEFVPIGLPFPGVDIYILDENLMCMADGEEGEIFIAGDCVVDGYLNMPDLTEERFLINPFSSARGKLLSTGDLARRLRNGHILVSGRSDRQVKVRGYRVELDGIESLIASHADIVSAVVIYDRGPKGHDILISYVQVSDKADITAESIREFCASNCPNYMIPHKIIFLDDMPLTPSGKIDRKALPAVTNTTIAIKDRCDLSPTEDAIRRIWCGLLQLPDLASSESFFKAGGDSLLMISMLSEVSKKFNCNIPLEHVAQEPSIEKIHHLLKLAEHTAPQVKSFLGFDDIQAELLEKIMSIPLHEAPLSMAQSSIYLHEQIVDGNPYGITISAVLSGPLDIKALEDAATYLVKTNPVLSTQIFITAEGLHQRTNDNSKVCFDVIQMRCIPGETKEQCINKHIASVASMRLDLQHSPPLFLRVLKTGNQEAVLIIQVSHLICDGQSVRILVQQLSEAYALRISDKSLPTKEPDRRFLAYCQWESRSFGPSGLLCDKANTSARSRDAIASTLKYWETVLPNLKLIETLKTDLTEEAHVMLFSGQEIIVEVDKEVIDTYLERISLPSVTPFHLFFASFSKAIYHTMGYSNQVIGFATGLRPEGHENTLGCYVSVFPCFINVRNDTESDSFLTEVSNTLWGTLSHGHIPFEAVINYFRAKGMARNFRGFNIVVSFDDLASRFLRLSGVHTKPCRVSNVGVSKFPLSFNIEVTDTGFVFSFEYRTSLYQKETINKLAQRFLHELFSYVKQ